jgi:hypothetical protein
MQIRYEIGSGNGSVWHPLHDATGIDRFAVFSA